MVSARMRKIGWICFSLAWIPFAGIFIGMAKLPEGSYDWVELPLLARVSMIGAGSLMVLAMIFLLGSMLYSSIKNKELMNDGKSASATIVKIEPTGQTVNNYYVGMSFLLDVKPINEPSFQARAEKLIPMPMLAQYHIGSLVNVKFDPKSQAVAIPDENLVSP